MIQELRLANIKGFRGSHSAPLAPITLIFGQNSAGKSALLQTLALLAQSSGSRRQLTRADQPLLFAGRFIDLGGYTNTVHGHDESQHISIGLSVSADNTLRIPAPAVLEGLSQVDYDFTVAWDKSSLSVIPVKATLGINGLNSATVELSSAPSPVHGNLEDEPGWTTKAHYSAEAVRNLLKWIDTINILRAERESSRGSDRPPRLFDRALSTVPASIADEVLRRSQGQDIAAPVTWDGPIPDFDRRRNRLSRSLGTRDQRINTTAETTDQQTSALNPSDEASDEQLQALLDSLLAFTNASRYLITGSLQQIAYLGPMRAAPQRLEEIQPHIMTTTSSDGGGTTLAIYRETGLADKVNSALRQMNVPYSVTAVPVWNESFPSVGEYLALQLVDLRTDTPVSPRDVGYGLSQLLPVLVEAFRQRRGTLLVEQPELHLHPRLQGELAQVLAMQAVEARSQIIMETHSENMVLRLQRLIREGRLSSDQVQVLYVGAESNEGSWIKSINFSPSGELVDEWPDGFFEERLAEY